MQYYQELLESFEKLKKRKFKLTIMEQEQGKLFPAKAHSTEDIIKARGDLQNFYQGLRGSLAPGQTVAGMPANSAWKERANTLTAYKDDRGLLMLKGISLAGAEYSFNPLTALNKSTEGHGKNLISWYLGQEGGEAQDQQGQGGQEAQYQDPAGQGSIFANPAVMAPLEEPLPAGGTIAEKLAKRADGTRKQKEALINHFRAMRPSAEDLYKKLTQEELDKMPGVKGVDGFGARFTGGQNFSLESQFANATSLLYIEGDEKKHLIGMGDMSLVTQSIAARKLSDLLRKANKKNVLAVTEAEQLRSSFRFLDSKDNGVFIVTGGTVDNPEGMMFADSGGALKAAMMHAEGKMKDGKSFKVVELASIPQGLSSFRGKNLELVSRLRILAKLCIESRGGGERGY